ncbi:tetratricopeptide repeat protein [Flavobacterium sp. HJJ]|uniref:tetratricopeptide repeat protein n=1 Tax=Flavobacterium sp. HJJ TaxID=2783792 RepID=UPI00188A0234|nr:tetratricopeptide repeat protein [Flavobacterium sp. HJJ]MBF4470199.1 tetratricopeptide repeat protein [Flavobacterium sp. HJJ]
MKLLLSIFLLFPLLLLSQSFEKGEKLFIEKRYDQAQPIFENFLKSNPNNLKTIEYLGDIAAYHKSWDKAISYYKKLKVTNSKEADYYFKYGGALAMKTAEVSKLKALGMVGEVRTSFEKAIELNPKHIEARWALIELNLQLPGIVGGSESKAIKYSSELRELSPVDGYLSRGHIEEYFKRYTEAEKQYKRAILIGGSKVCYQALADFYKNKMKQPDKANTVWEEYRNKKK